jgi:hypothetical protein
MTAAIPVHARPSGPPQTPAWLGPGNLDGSPGSPWGARRPAIRAVSDGSPSDTESARNGASLGARPIPRGRAPRPRLRDYAGQGAMDSRYGIGLDWDTPPIGAAERCSSCPGTWTYDEVYGWLHSPEHQPDCAVPPARIMAAVIR